ncbi:hypothetical protein EVAR_6021_1 [Eumeta japonica]|uniref:Uncharacterized protein n=1 Tax=Eumeta variegata TaxID=151549 RepID=A0A4C1TAL2_EUMVA|nr:hypothetical protein EVAR_6021_1 [Eumeta japonica]
MIIWVLLVTLGIIRKGGIAPTRPHAPAARRLLKALKPSSLQAERTDRRTCRRAGREGDGRTFEVHIRTLSGSGKGGRIKINTGRLWSRRRGHKSGCIHGRMRAVSNMLERSLRAVSFECDSERSFSKIEDIQASEACSSVGPNVVTTDANSVQPELNRREVLKDQASKSKTKTLRKGVFSRKPTSAQYNSLIICGMSPEQDAIRYQAMDIDKIN